MKALLRVKLVARKNPMLSVVKAYTNQHGMFPRPITKGKTMPKMKHITAKKYKTTKQPTRMRVRSYMGLHQKKTNKLNKAIATQTTNKDVKTENSIYAALAADGKLSLTTGLIKVLDAHVILKYFCLVTKIGENN